MVEPVWMVSTPTPVSVTKDGQAKTAGQVCDFWLAYKSGEQSFKYNYPNIKIRIYNRAVYISHHSQIFTPISKTTL